MLLAAQEKLMLKAFLVLFITRLMKIIHVELSDERTEVVMFEIFWKNIFCEGIRVFDNETISFHVPKYSFAVIDILKEV